MNEDIFHLAMKAIIRNADGKILLVKVNPKELKETADWHGEAYWDIPGGRLKKGGSAEETLMREVAEETGISNFKSIQPFAMTLANIRIPVGNDTVGLVLSTYLCELGDVQEMKISPEHVDAEWFSPHEAAELLSFKYPQEFTEKIAKL